LKLKRCSHDLNLLVSLLAKDERDALPSGGRIIQTRIFLGMCLSLRMSAKRLIQDLPIPARAGRISQNVRYKPSLLPLLFKFMMW
jgi:hypothetical protein